MDSGQLLVSAALGLLWPPPCLPLVPGRGLLTPPYRTTVHHGRKHAAVAVLWEVVKCSPSGINSCFLPQKEVLFRGSLAKHNGQGCWKGRRGLQGSLYLQTSVQMRLVLLFPWAGSRVWVIHTILMEAAGASGSLADVWLFLPSSLQS